MPEKKHCRIFFHSFDSEKINREGWGGDEGQLDLKLTHPHRGKSIDALDEAIEKEKFQYIGDIESIGPNDVYASLQNIEKPHKLKNRSMMVGDVAICNDEGFMVENTGFSTLSKDQIQKMKSIHKQE